MYQLLLFCFLLSFYNIAYAQERVISGKVTSPADGAPLPGVNVLIKGTSQGTITDIDGNYSISANDTDVLVFSFVGFSNLEVPVSSIRGNTHSVVLQEDVQALSEVVVIGYGSQEKRDATGAVASVKAEDFNTGVISSPEQLIQGKSAGVQITTASGEPGAGVNIRIRGTASVRGGNDPLFVVDGVPLSGGEASAGGTDLGRGSSSAKNPLNFINPNDIASIDILKDASATAIYGSRGANGVVLITTKSGKGQNHAIEYGTTFSISRMANRYDLLDRDQFLEGIAATGGNVEEQNFGHDTDWQDEISRTAISHRHDISYSNSIKSGNYRASISFDDQQGVIENSGMERITGRLNFNNNFFNDKLEFGAQLTFSRVNDEGAPITDNAGYEGDLLGAAYMANPTWSSSPDEQVQGSIANPNALLKHTQDNTETNRALINLSLSYEILEGLKFRVNTGFDRSESSREGAWNSELVTIGGVAGNGRAFIADLDKKSDLLETFFNYDKDFGNSSISAVLGYSYQEFSRKGITLQGWGFDGSNLDAMVGDLSRSASTLRGAIDQPYQQFGFTQPFDKFFIGNIYADELSTDIDSRPSVPVQAVTGDAFHEIDELQSFFGRINYNLLDKYLFTATLRADGSTKFGGNNKYGYFPSGAIAWRLSDESFVPDLFDDLKLRLGYGITGNQEIPHNLHQARIRYSGISIQDDGNINPAGRNNITFQNKDLQWEETSQLNLGLDFAFFNSRLNGSFDFYNKVTTGLLMQVFAAQPAPQPFYWRNLDGDVVNRGVEITLNYVAIASENLGLDFGFNISYNKNEVRNFNGIYNTGGINGQGLTGAFAQRIEEGQPLYAFYLRDFVGYDENGQSIYAEGDFQQYLDKSPLPKYNLGFSINLSYKNWDLTTFLAGQFGHYVYNNTANAFFTKGSLGNGRNVTEDVLTSDESPVNAPDVSTRFLEKGDFLRLQNLNLGYNFSLHDSFIKSLRIYGSGQNLFVITDYSGLDPEVNVNKALNGIPSLGIDYTAYPRARTFSLGLNATF